MFSLYLGHVGEQSKIWLGGYDRSIVRKMLSRYQPTKAVDIMTDEELDGEIKWLRLVSQYYWMAEFDSAEIDGEPWPITVNSLIFDSGSSINHIPTKEYNILLTEITKNHTCQVERIPYETYYCVCDGADDDSFPTLQLHSSDV